MCVCVYQTRQYGVARQVDHGGAWWNSDVRAHRGDTTVADQHERILRDCAGLHIEQAAGSDGGYLLARRRGLLLSPFFGGTGAGRVEGDAPTGYRLTAP